MNRIGALVALAVAAVVGIVFGAFPGLDLAIARWFYSPELLASRAVELMRDLSMVLVGGVVAPAAGVLVLKLIFPHRRMLITGRAVILLTATLLIGPGLVTNLLLKDYWNRPRPWEVAQFGGPHQFQPWWDPRGTCHKNCSFVAGEVSGAAWTLAPAALAPPAWRAAAYAGALGFAAAVGVGRMMLGGHFFSDVVFAIVFTFLIVWCVHGFLYRWRTRPAEGAIEAAIARVGLALRRPFGGAGSPA